MTRRDLFKTSLSVPAVVAAAESAMSEAPQTQPPARSAAGTNGGRERLLLDFGWRFHFGHATDAALDFDFRGNFSKDRKLRRSEYAIV